MLLFAPLANAQVSPVPFLKPHWTNRSGQPCAGCLLNSYIAGTTTPQQTFSDALGINPNTNPVVLDAFGEAFVFLLANSYKLTLTTPSGVLMWTADNVTSSNLSLLASNNVWTGTNTFQATTTFNGHVNFNVGFVSLGPNTIGGGGSFAGTFSGSPIFSGTPNFSAGFLATTGSFSGQITSTLATGTAPFVIASTTQVPNLNVSQLESCTWEIPCAIGMTTPNTGKFTTLEGVTSVKINGVTISGTPAAGNVVTASSPTVAGWAAPALTSVQAVNNNNVATITINNTNTTVATQAITFPASGCPCRAFISYALFLDFAGVTNQPNINFWVSDGTNIMAATQTGQSNASVGAKTLASYGGFSSVGYANGVVKTFTLTGIQPGTAGATVQGTASSGSGFSTFQVSVLPSVN